MANIFYSLGKIFGLTGKMQERAFFTQRINFLGQSGAVYLDTDVPYKLFNSIPELNQVVDKKHR